MISTKTIRVQDLPNNLLTKLEGGNFSKFEWFPELKKALSKQVQDFIQNIKDLSGFTLAEIYTNDKLAITATEFPRKLDKNNSFALLCDEAQPLWSALKNYQEKIYTKFGMFKYYILNLKEITKETEKYLLSFCESRQTKAMDRIQKDLKKITKAYIKHFNKEFDTTSVKYEGIQSYYQKHRTLQLTHLKKFQEQVNVQMKEPVCDVILSAYIKKLDDAIKDSVIRRLDKSYLKDSGLFELTIKKELEQMFQKHFIDGSAVNIFEPVLLGGVENVETILSIIVLTDYKEFNEDKGQAYIDTIGRIICLVNKNLSGHLEGLKNFQGRPETRDYLEFYKNKWNQGMTLKMRLFGMTSLFLAFNFIADDTMDTSYSSYIRYMLNCIFRNLQSPDLRFQTCQILSCLESLATADIRAGEEPYVGLNASGMIKARMTVKRIRGTVINTIFDHSKHKNQFELLNLQLEEGFDLAKKMIIEKISPATVVSKNVIICISGFVSEILQKSMEWGAVVEMFPDTEVFALNWKSNAVSFITWKVMKKVRHNLSLNPLKVMKDVYNEILNSWNNTYEEARVAGKNLAHYLANAYLFKGYSISLVGFSLGTLVIMTCIWELEKMNRNDIIYDVLLMGGVAHIDGFYSQALSAVNNRLINCYSSSDCVLGYLLKHSNSDLNPVGLGPILRSSNKRFRILM